MEVFMEISLTSLVQVKCKGRNKRSSKSWEIVVYVLCLGDLWKLLRKFFLKISKRNSLCESVVALYLDFNLFLEMVMQVYNWLRKDCGNKIGETWTGTFRSS